MNEIDKLIKECTNPGVKKLLLKLKRLNNRALMFMMGERMGFQKKYKKLQKTAIWRDAKQVFIEYQIKQGNFNCPICNTFLNFTRCTLHHPYPYHTKELFTPTFIQLIHGGCHHDFHKK